MRKLIVGALVLVANTNVAHAQQVQVFSPARTVQVHSGVRLHPTTQEDFDLRFRKAEYFGAFMVSPSGAYGWSQNHLTEDTAISEAAKTCDGFRLPSEAECTLYATLTPIGYQNTGDQTLNYEATQDFLNVRDGTDGAAAFVVSDGGSWGWSSGYDSEFEAISGAFNSCIAELVSEEEMNLEEYPCHLVWVRP